MRRILLIDDNGFFRSLLRRELERVGYQVVEASEGGEALRCHRQQPADLVLCDLFMPGREGLETIRELRQTSLVPIIAMTGDGPSYAPAMLGPAQILGASRCLLKPFEMPALLEAMREVLDTVPASPSDAQPS